MNPNVKIPRINSVAPIYHMTPVVFSFIAKLISNSVSPYESRAVSFLAVLTMVRNNLLTPER